MFEFWYQLSWWEAEIVGTLKVSCDIWWQSHSKQNSKQKFGFPQQPPQETFWHCCWRVWWHFNTVGVLEIHLRLCRKLREAIAIIMGTEHLRQGFLKSIQLILKLQEGGLATAGPPCGSFVFVNLGTSKRSRARPFGAPLEYVRKANRTLGT